MSSASNEIMILRIWQILLCLLVVAPAYAAPASKSAQFSWQGERVPIVGRKNWAGEPENADWQKLARLLRVRDLRVYNWPSQIHKNVNEKDVEAQQKQVLGDLRAVGYRIEKMGELEECENQFEKYDGFTAQRGNETLALLWRNHYGTRHFYWGHQAPGQKRDDELLQSVAAEDSARVQAALQAGANPRAIDYSGFSALNLAANTGEIPLVKLLLQAMKTRGAALPDIGVWLNFAVKIGDVELLQLFIDRGATPQQIGAALQVAAAHGATKCATLLLPHAPRDYVNSALWQASYVEEFRGSAIQYPDIVELLLTRKPDKRALDVALLHVAGFDDQGIVVPLLLEAGADPNASDEQGETPLIHALKDYDPNSVRNLLKAGADPNAREADGTPALVLALGTPFDLDELLKYSPDPGARTKSGATVLDVARNTLESLTKKAAQKENPNYKDDQAYRDKYRKIVARLEALTQSPNRR